MTVTKTAIFDAFRTVMLIGRRANPYRQLLREGIKQGRRPHPGDAHVIMTLNLELHELAEHVGILLSESWRVEMECALQAELNSIEAYPDASRRSLCSGSVALLSVSAATLPSPMARRWSSFSRA
ncbi:hypothetical protein AL052_17575 [Pseudomonas amygdali pv. eriobotryae]|nr:hypothetical protein AL052_17575 [Pseudomonas amygdali pv. eriobotryae]